MRRLGVGRGTFDRLGIALLIGAILSATAASLPTQTVLQGWLSDASAGLRAEIFGARPMDDAAVVVVGMDERTLSAPELDGTPQVLFTPIYARMAKKAFDHGARGVVFDVILAYDAKNFQLNDELPLRRYDDAFLSLLRAERASGRLVLGRSARLLPARRFALVAGELGTAMVEVPLGAGGVVRSVPTALPDSAGQVHKTLSGRGLALLGHDRSTPVNIIPPAPISTLPSLSMIDLLRCEETASLERMLKDRVLYVGGALPGQDRLKSPDQLMARALPGLLPTASFGGISKPPAADERAEPAPCDFEPPQVRGTADTTVPGVFLHAAAVDAVASGWELRSTPAWVAWMVIFVAATLAGLSALLLRPVWGVLSMATIILGTVLTSVLLFSASYFAPLGWGLVAAPLGFIAAYGTRIRLLDRRTVLVRREFGRYLSPVLVRQLMDEGTLPDLAGEERDVTVMFADLNGFTAASEKVSSVELMRVLNRYLDVIAGIISDHGGYVDKFIGDAAMAIFNAPVPLDDHGRSAVAAAHEIQRRVAAMAEDDARDGTLAFGIKVGIATGRATVGNVGARERLNYTVVGEIVNLAARLEGMPSLLGTPIVIGPNTAERVRDNYALLRIARLTVKGRSTGVDVYAPFQKSGEATNEQLGRAIRRYDDALNAFELGRFEDAAARWRASAESDWPGATIAAAMAREAARRADRPPVNWNGLLDPTLR